ncbi:hypothetical protein D3C87_2210360 [compost metagenome]
MHAHRSCDLNGTEDVCRIPGSGEGEKDISSLPVAIHLLGENHLRFYIIGKGSYQGSVIS